MRGLITGNINSLIQISELLNDQSVQFQSVRQAFIRMFESFNISLSQIIQLCQIKSLDGELLENK